MHQPASGIARPDIQALRALAVLLVVLYHAGVPFFGGGYVGVDVFFVISGYLITSSLVREASASGRIDLPAFYARRARRLLPMSALVVAAVALACFALLSPIENSNLAPSVLFSATYLSNLWFAKESTDYLAPEVHDNPLLHTWSLSVEEQFYVVWPLIILLAVRGVSVRRDVRLGVAMLATIVVSLLATLWVQRFAQPWAFFASPLRAWEFAAGGALVALRAAPANVSPRSASALGLVGFLCVVGAAVAYGASTPFPGLTALLPVGGTALAIYAGSVAPTVFHRAAEQPAVRWLGDASYSIYLWHWPLIVLPALLWGEQAAWSRLASVLASLGLAALSYRFVENPLRELPVLKRSVRLSLAGGAAMTMVGAAMALGLRAASQSAFRSVEQQQLANLDDVVSANREAGCHLAYTDVKQPECVFGDTSSQTTVMLFGDSHAGHLFPAMESLADSLGFRLISASKSSCPSVLVEPSEAKLGRAYTECREWQESMYDRLAREQPDVVVISNFRDHQGSEADEDSYEEWRAGLHESLDRLEQLGVRTVVVGDTPEFPVSVPECLSRAAWRDEPDSTCDVSRDIALDSTRRAYQNVLVAEHPNARWVDPSGPYCDSIVCFAERNGIVLFRDRSHLTVEASKLLASTLAPYVIWGAGQDSVP